MVLSILMRSEIHEEPDRDRRSRDREDPAQHTRQGRVDGEGEGEDAEGEDDEANECAEENPQRTPSTSGHCIRQAQDDESEDEEGGPDRRKPVQRSTPANTAGRRQGQKIDAVTADRGDAIDMLQDRRIRPPAASSRDLDRREGNREDHGEAVAPQAETARREGEHQVRCRRSDQTAGRERRAATANGRGLEVGDVQTYPMARGGGR